MKPRKSHFKKSDRLIRIIEQQSIEIKTLTKTIDKLINIHFYSKQNPGMNKYCS